MICNRMAKLSEYAYLDGKQAKPKMKSLGYTDYKFFENDGAQCHSVWNEEEYVLVFRGTEPEEISDVLADLKVWPTGSMTHGLVHSGFKDEVDKLWSDIKSHYEKHQRVTGKGYRRFMITGHSLGAAMATIATSRFEEFTNVHQLITFGSPRVGTRSFVKSIHTPHYRFVNNNDIVTQVPVSLMGYKHHGTLQYINFYGNIRKMTGCQLLKDRWRGWRSGLLDSIEDHGMPHYVMATESLEY